MGNIIQKLGFMGYLMETGPNRYMCPNVHRADEDKLKNEEQVKQEAMMQGLERCHEWDAT